MRERGVKISCRAFDLSLHWKDFGIDLLDKRSLLGHKARQVLPANGRTDLKLFGRGK
jgi:hypothetical protein